MIGSVRNFLRYFDAESLGEQRSVERLNELLDLLLIAYRESDDIGPESDLQPPSLDFKQTRALMQSRFPDFAL